MKPACSLVDGNRRKFAGPRPSKHCDAKMIFSGRELRSGILETDRKRIREHRERNRLGFQRDENDAENTSRGKERSYAEQEKPHSFISQKQGKRCSLPRRAARHSPVRADQNKFLETLQVRHAFSTLTDDRFR